MLDKEIFENEKLYYKLQGIRTDLKAHFYYDESNNCRKFWIKPKSGTGRFNVNPYEDFVLAGVVDLDSNSANYSFDELKNDWNCKRMLLKLNLKNNFRMVIF